MVLMSFRTQNMVLQNKFIDTYALHSIGVHCMAHCTNLVIQTSWKLLLVVWIESLLQYLYIYFAHFPKKHLEIKILKLMATKENKIFQIVKTRWILMLSLAKKVMMKYKILFVKMALNNPTNV